jgi:hypothetical protein
MVIPTDFPVLSLPFSKIPAPPNVKECNISILLACRKNEFLLNVLPALLGVE